MRIDDCKTYVNLASPNCKYTFQIFNIKEFIKSMGGYPTFKIMRNSVEKYSCGLDGVITTKAIYIFLWNIVICFAWSNIYYDR